MDTENRDSMVATAQAVAEDNAYQAGRDAFLQGKKESAAPWAADTDLGIVWRDGFYDAQA